MIHQSAALFLHITPFVMVHINVNIKTATEGEKELLFAFFPLSYVFRSTNQFHFWVAEPQALLSVKGVPSGHVNHAAIG